MTRGDDDARRTSFLDRSPTLAGVPRWLGRLCGLRELETAWAELPPGGSDDEPFTRFLEGLDIELEVTDRDLARIPERGPLLVIANHPTGMLDGLVLGALMARRRQDALLLANHVLTAIPELESRVLPLDPFGGREPATLQRNRLGLRRAVAHLKAGGAVGIFPAGEVASLSLSSRRIAEPRWKDSASRLARAAGARVLPVFVEGRNSALFQTLGLVSPRLRTALLPRELMNKKNRRVAARVGEPLDPPPSRDGRRPRGIPIEELRQRTLLLRASIEEARVAKRSRGKDTDRPPVPGPRHPASALSREIAALPEDRRLVESDDWRVLVVRHDEAPVVMDELGRLRELTFREIGEGTGRDRDIDDFDRDYDHLVLWDGRAERLVGAYRLRSVEPSSRDGARPALYTRTLFDFDAPFLRALGPSAELGRSFVRREYQGGLRPLDLLWRGIGAWLSRHPGHRRVFGAVSMSASYTQASREILVAWLRRHHAAREFEGLVRPTRPFRFCRAGHFDPGALAESVADIGEISRLVAQIEPDGRGVPVLWRQYLRVGARVAAFNVDRAFASCVDGLVIIDLDQAPARVRERYLGAGAPMPRILGPRPRGPADSLRGDPLPDPRPRLENPVH